MKIEPLLLIKLKLIYNYNNKLFIIFIIYIIYLILILFKYLNIIYYILIINLNLYKVIIKIL